MNRWSGLTWMLVFMLTSPVLAQSPSYDIFPLGRTPEMNTIVYSAALFDYKNAKVFTCNVRHSATALAGNCVEKKDLNSFIKPGANVKTSLPSSIGARTVVDYFWQVDQSTGTAQFCLLYPPVKVASCIDVTPR